MGRDTSAEKMPKKTSLPGQILRTAIYLASEDSAFVMGQLVIVDGNSAFQ
jgi:hypothetical protein